MFQLFSPFSYFVIFSAQENEELAGIYFGYIEIAIENVSNKWITIKDIEIDFDEENIRQNTRILSGRDFLAWKEAVFAKKALDDYNKRVVQSLVFTAGLGLVTLSDNKNVNQAGAGAVMGSSVSMSIDEYKRVKNFNQLENARIFPENHLLYGEILIPPGYFTRKFLVLDITSGKVQEYIHYLNLIVDIEIPDKETELTRELKLKFRKKLKANGTPKSKWQKDLYKLRANIITIEKTGMDKKENKTTITKYLFSLKRTHYDIYEAYQPFLEENYMNNLLEVEIMEKETIEKTKKRLIYQKENIGTDDITEQTIINYIRKLKNGNQDIYQALIPFLKKEFSEELKKL